MLSSHSSDFAEYLLNFIKIDSKSVMKISENKQKLILYLIVSYGIPILSEAVKSLFSSNIFSTYVKHFK
jgi:hypothetical protein